MKVRKRSLLWVRGLIALMLAVCCVSCAKSPEELWQEQYDLGVRYLSENNYEEAVLTFTAAIEIDPRRAEAYAAAAEAYIAMGDIDSAIAILEQGYTATNDNALLEQKSSIDIVSKSWRDFQIMMFGHLITMPITGAELEQLGFEYESRCNGVWGEGTGYTMSHPKLGSAVSLFCSPIHVLDSDDPADWGSTPLCELNIVVEGAIDNELEDEYASAIKMAGNLSLSSSKEDVINAYGPPTVEDENAGIMGVDTLHYRTSDDAAQMTICFLDGRMYQFVLFLNPSRYLGQ